MKKIHKLGIELERLQLIITDDDKDYRFGKVVLIQVKWLNKKLMPFDSESGKPIIKMCHFYDVDRKYHEIDIDKIYASSLLPFKTDYSVWFLDI